jgi:hypothetical protein
VGLTDFVPESPGTPADLPAFITDLRPFALKPVVIAANDLDFSAKCRNDRPILNNPGTNAPTLAALHEGNSLF